MIGAIMGIGGALMGTLGANSASNQSWQKQHQLMEIQAELNQKKRQVQYSASEGNVELHQL